MTGLPVEGFRPPDAPLVLVHIVPHSPSGWRIRVAGVGLLEPWFPTKRQARRAARAVAELVQPAEIIPHRRDGSFEKHGRSTIPRRRDPADSEG